MRLFKAARGCFLALALSSACSAAYAAPVWYLVDIIQAGSLDFGGAGVTIIRATETGGLFTNKIFNVSPAMGKEALASGLAAIALGRPMFIRADLVGVGLNSAYRPINAVLLVN